MYLDELPKIRGKLFNFYGQYFSALGVAPTPAELVHTDDRWGFRLLRYKGVHNRMGKPIKLLLVSHIINRPYILDLSTDVSVVHFLSQQGIEVFMIDWGDPKPANRDISFSHYTRYVTLATRIMETENPFILGYCTGGIIALIWASLHPQSLKALTLLGTPVDFADWHDPRLLWGKFFDARGIGDSFGNIPGELIDAVGMQLFALYMPLFAMDLTFWQEFTEVEAFKNHWRRWRWLVDTPAIPRSAYQQFIEDCYQHNRLIQNRMVVDKQQVDLRRIDCPLLNILARYDNIVPIESGRALAKIYHGNDYREILFGSTHIGLTASRKARHHLWPRVARWLKTRGEYEHT